MNILFISLGCDKNLVDSEVMLGLLDKKGYQIVDSEEDADIIVISAGVPRLPGQTRLDTLGASIECIKDVVDNLNKTDIKGIIITITNPADIIAYYVRKHTGL